MPSCVTRMMGPARTDSETEPVHAKLLSILQKARRRLCLRLRCRAACPCCERCSRDLCVRL